MSNYDIVVKALRKRKRFFYNDKMINEVAEGDCPPTCPVLLAGGDCPRECPLAPLIDMDIFRCGCTTARMEIMPRTFEKKYSSNNCGNFLLYIKYNLLKHIIKI